VIGKELRKVLQPDTRNASLNNKKTNRETEDGAKTPSSVTKRAEKLATE